MDWRIVTGVRCAIAGSCALLSGSALRAQTHMEARGTSSPRETFLVRLGKDTLGFDRYVRSGNEVKGEALHRIPKAQLVRYHAILRADGTLDSLTVTTYNGITEASGIEQRTDVSRKEDSLVFIMSRDKERGPVVQRVPQGALPLFGSRLQGYALEELVARRAPEALGDSVRMTVQYVDFAGAGPEPVVLRRVARDRVDIVFEGDVHRTQMDRKDRLIRVDAPRSTAKMSADRVPDFDWSQLGQQFAAHPIRALSPHDTIKAAVGDAHVQIVYGRPQRRGRRIFGDVVPLGEVWRTGADAATVFTSDRDLMIGTALVPAGRYSLWSVPSAHGWTLVVNRQSGQWGTEHHADSDLVSIPMTVGRPATRVEAFTMTLVPQRAGAMLSLMWDDRSAAVPVRRPPK